MNSFYYLANPLREFQLPSRGGDTKSLATFVYGFENNANPIGIAIKTVDANSTARINAIMAHFFTPTENFSLWLAKIMDNATDATWAAEQALYYNARLGQWLDAARAYIRAVNPGKNDAELFANSPVSMDRLKVKDYVGGNEYSGMDIRRRVNSLTKGAAQLPLPSSAPVPVTDPVTVPTLNPTPTPTPTPQPAPQPATAAETVARWRLVLSDARRLETDASTIGLALRSVLQAWQAAGDYPDQVRTLTGLVQDAAANVDYARQLGAALATVIQVGETVLATGTGTLPDDPRVPPPPALPTVIPAKPDGTTPEVAAISVPTEAKALEKYTDSVVKPAFSAGKLVILAITLLSLFN